MNGGDEGEPVGFAPASGEGFADAVTLSWGDESAELFGLARVGVAPGSSVSALGVLFSGNDVIESVAEGGLSLGASDWSCVRAGALEISPVPDGWRLVWDERGH